MQTSLTQTRQNVNDVTRHSRHVERYTMTRFCKIIKPMHACYVPRVKDLFLVVIIAIPDTYAQEPVI